MNSNSIDVEFDNDNLEKELHEMSEDLPKEQFRAFIRKYYSMRVQGNINDKKYDELRTLEGLVDIYNFLG